MKIFFSYFLSVSKTLKKLSHETSSIYPYTFLTTLLREFLGALKSTKDDFGEPHLRTFVCFGK